MGGREGEGEGKREGGGRTERGRREGGCGKGGRGGGGRKRWRREEEEGGGGRERGRRAGGREMIAVQTIPVTPEALCCRGSSLIFVIFADLPKT